MKKIKKENIKKLLQEVSKKWNIYAPQKNINEDVLFDKLPEQTQDLEKALDNIILDAMPIISPKDIFFPQIETMFEFNNNKIEEKIETSSKLLWGVKSCDLNGILHNDEFYKKNFEDKYYLSRIQNRFIVVISCSKPMKNTCFCSSTKTGPFAESGYDLQLFETENTYLVEIGSEKGKEFVDEFANFFENSIDEIKQIKNKAIESIELKVDLTKALDLMSDNSVSDNSVPDDSVLEKIYQQISEKCISCGGCIYVCPTCTCFNVFDNAKNGNGERLRNWDGCFLEGYTREASGHNPRKEKQKRTTRRYEHKLKYDNNIIGKTGCIGCGRCLSSCPVNIGMSNFIQEITK